jgi:hypothetical protein
MENMYSELISSAGLSETVSNRKRKESDEHIPTQQKMIKSEDKVEITVVVKENKPTDVAGKAANINNFADVSKESSIRKQDIDIPIFIEATKFTGAKPGYIFKKGENGDLGYYIDDYKLAEETFVKSSSNDIKVASENVCDDNHRRVQVDIDTTLSKIEPHLINAKKISKAMCLLTQFIDTSLLSTNANRFFKAIGICMQNETFISDDGIKDEAIKSDYLCLIEAIMNKQTCFDETEAFQVKSWELCIHTQNLLQTDDSFQFRKAMNVLKTCIENVSSKYLSDSNEFSSAEVDTSADVLIAKVHMRYRLQAIIKCMQVAYRCYNRDWAKNPIEMTFLEASNRRLYFDPDLREELDKLTTSLTLERRKNTSWAGPQTIRTFNSVAHPLLQKKVGLLR